MAGQRVDWSNVRADYERLGTHAAVAELYGTTVNAVSQRLAPGTKTSVYLPKALAGRRDWVREYTGLKDADIYDRGLLLVEAELSAAFLFPQGQFCPHPARYPNGACTRCYAAPPGMPVPESEAGDAGG